MLLSIVKRMLLSLALVLLFKTSEVYFAFNMRRIVSAILMFSSLGSISNESSSIHLHAPTAALQICLYQCLCKEIVNALVSIKIRMVLIDYVKLGKFCLRRDDKHY